VAEVLNLQNDLDSNIVCFHLHCSSVMAVQA
jgi:hypothetical protein